MRLTKTDKEAFVRSVMKSPSKSPRSSPRCSRCRGRL